MLFWQLSAVEISFFVACLSSLPSAFAKAALETFGVLMRPWEHPCSPRQN